MLDRHFELGNISTKDVLLLYKMTSCDANFDKYRISTYPRAKLFLDSACFLKDEVHVYDRVADLQEPGDFLAADIY